jgi:hypothetical protein
MVWKSRIRLQFVTMRIAIFISGCFFKQIWFYSDSGTSISQWPERCT